MDGQLRNDNQVRHQFPRWQQPESPHLNHHLGIQAKRESFLDAQKIQLDQSWAFMKEWLKNTHWQERKWIPWTKGTRRNYKQISRSKANTLTFDIMQVFIVFSTIALSVLFCNAITRCFFFSKSNTNSNN